MGQEVQIGIRFKKEKEMLQDYLKLRAKDSERANISEQIRICDILSKIKDKNDVYMVFDSGIFNDVVKKYICKAMDNLLIENQLKFLVLGELNTLLDTLDSNEVMALDIRE